MKLDATLKRPRALYHRTADCHTAAKRRDRGLLSLPQPRQDQTQSAEACGVLLSAIMSVNLRLRRNACLDASPDMRIFAAVKRSFRSAARRSRQRARHIAPIKVNDFILRLLKFHIQLTRAA